MNLRGLLRSWPEIFLSIAVGLPLVLLVCMLWQALREDHHPEVIGFLVWLAVLAAGVIGLIYRE